MEPLRSAPVPSAAILGGDLRGSWSWQGSRQSGELRHQTVEETDLKKMVRDVSNASTFASECEDSANHPPHGVPSAAILGGDCRGPWSWQGTRQSGETRERAAPPPRQQPSSASASDEGRPQGALSAAILGGDDARRASWSWQGSCGSGETPAVKSQPIVAAAAADDGEREGVPSAAILGGDLRSPWSWQGRQQSGGTASVPAAGAPAAEPPARFDGVPSAAILGGDLRSPWCWHGSGQGGETHESERKDVAVAAEDRLPRAGVVSSIVLGASPERAEAWKWR